MTNQKPQNVPMPTLIGINRKEEQPSPLSGGQKVWIEGPGATTWLVEGGKLLFRAYETIYGQKTTHIDWVRAYADTAAKQLLIVPAQAEADDTAQVTKKDSNLQINLSALLRKAKLEVASGYKEQFSVSLEQNTAIGIAVVVDMHVAEKRKVISKKARTNESQ